MSGFIDIMATESDVGKKGEDRRDYSGRKPNDIFGSTLNFLSSCALTTWWAM